MHASPRSDELANQHYLFMQNLTPLLLELGVTPHVPYPLLTTIFP